MSGTPYILFLPEIALEKIFSFLTYDEIAKNRIVAKMSEEEDLLDIFLSTATEDEEKIRKDSSLKEVDIFKGEQDTIDNIIKELNSDKKSLVHSGDTDSSDDEDNKNPEDRKYNDCGKDIKRILNDTSLHTRPVSGFYGPRERTSWKPTSTTSNVSKPISNIQKKPPADINKQNCDVFIDPLFHIRIVNPLVSSAVLQERMSGRDAVQFCNLTKYLQTKTSDRDWVLAGVVANKSAVRTSQKGQKFLIWTLTDLKDDIKTVSLFLFGSAYDQLWKTQVGVVVGILNPSVLDRKDGSRDVASLSINNAQKVMIFGTSKDLGTCRSVKKDGQKCTAIVNVNKCEYCLYHIKQEYQKCSLRSELQSNYVGKGLVALRNKVLGKNEVFYAGKSYMAIPAKKSRKLEQRDNNTLDSLNGLSALSKNIVKATKRGPNKKKLNASRLEVPHAQRMRDMELLRKLAGGSDIESKTHFSGNHSADVLSLEESKNLALNVISKLKSKKSVEKEETKNVQYDRKADLIVNVDNKKNFSGKISEGVSLEESKTLAKDVIAKLKEKNSVTEEIINETELNNEILNELDFDDDFNLDYDDDEIINKPEEKKKETVADKKTKDSPSQIERNSSKVLGVSPKSSSTNKKENLNPIMSSTPNKNTTNSSSIKNSPKVTDILAPNKPKTPKASLEAVKSGPEPPTSAPSLSRFGGSNGFIDLNAPVRRKTMDRAKLNAIKFIQANGPIKKIDPNSTKSSTTTNGKKRVVPESDVEELNPKKSKLAESELISDRFKRMMAVSSRHADLLAQRDDEEQEKYFKKQEIKEQMEEKMASTFKIACKAVRCLKCKYTNFSASEYCKKEGHPLKVFDAMKRFFKCGNCQNRTVSLEIIPTTSCKNCGSGKWERTGMMKEKIIGVAHQLSIRGGEQKFVNSVATDANINLLVPESD